MLYRTARWMEFDGFIFPSRIFSAESQGRNQFFYFRDSGHGVNNSSVYPLEKPCILPDKRRISNVCISDAESFNITASCHHAFKRDTR